MDWQSSTSRMSKNLARGVRQESKFFFRVLLCFGNCPGTKLSKYDDFSQFFPQNMTTLAHLFPKNPLYPSHWILFYFCHGEKHPRPPLLPGPPKKKNTGWDTRYQNIHSFNDIKYWNMMYLLWSNSLQIVYMGFDFGLWTCTFCTQHSDPRNRVVSA